MKNIPSQLPRSSTWWGVVLALVSAGAFAAPSQPWASLTQAEVGAGLEGAPSVDAPTSAEASRPVLLPREGDLNARASAHLLDEAGVPAARTPTAHLLSPKALAIATGASFLLTHVASFAAIGLYSGILNDKNWIEGKGPNGPVLAGSFLELLLAFGNIGTAVTLYPVAKQTDEALAMGYVALRTLESGVIVTGALSLLAAATLRQPSAEPGSLAPLGRSLVAVHDWSFLIGPGFTSGLNTIVMAATLLKSGAVPKWIAILGLIGGSLVFGSATAVLAGAFPQYSIAPALLAIPEFAWEISLAGFMAYKGFAAPEPF